MFKVKIGPTNNFRSSEYLKITLQKLFLVQNFLVILIKQELANSELVALSYDDFLVLCKCLKIKSSDRFYRRAKKYDSVGLKGMT